MKTTLAALLLIAALGTDAQAGGRCHRSTWHTTSSSHGWSHSCYGCHKPQTAQSNLIGLAKLKTEWLGTVQGLAQLGFVPTPQASGAYASASVSGGAPYAQQGSTVMGYGAIAPPPNVDIGALFNQSGRLAEQANEDGATATANFSALISQQAGSQAEVARILAQGQAARDALLAARGAPAAPTYQTFHLEARVGSNGALEIKPAGPEPAYSALSVSTALQTTLANRCNSCHSGPDAPKGLDLTQAPAWAHEQRLALYPKILARITSTDPAKRMPLKADGSPGDPLPGTELESLILGLAPTAASGAVEETPQQ